MRANAAAALWGFSEATVFFLVPDVILTYVGALRGARAALVASGFALAGTLIGGTVTYWLGARMPDAVTGWLASIPAISPGMVTRVQDDVRSSGVWAMVLGPLSGTPYKIYAAAAGAQGVPYLIFLAASVLARLPRFALAGAGAAFLAWIVPRLSRRIVQMLWLGFWIAFYAFYFAVMPR
jgi:membrane protein YqaA with SNARE-associated domain